LTDQVVAYVAPVLIGGGGKPALAGPLGEWPDRLGRVAGPPTWTSQALAATSTSAFLAFLVEPVAGVRR